MNNRSDVSFLIGSGFSVPAEYPTTSEINQRLGKIDQADICIHSSGNAWFLNNHHDHNASWMNAEHRYFVQELLEFYQSTVLESSGTFHYETFYDYYRHALEFNRCPDELIPFFRDFRSRHSNVIGTDEHLLQRFHQTFSKLLVNIFWKKPKRSHLAKPYDPKYEKFLLLAEYLGKTSRVHFHSLNHDLWLERLAISDSINAEMDDGFEELGSPYYGIFDSGEGYYTVRLSRFTNRFNHRFCLYKLHGSIDHYWFQGDNVSDLVKLKWGISQSRLYKELQVNGRFQYAEGRGDFYPDYLTGATHKKASYKHGTYYPVILSHFEANLIRSRALIVIGYGFKDSGINEYIETHFLADTSKPVFVVGHNEQPTWKHFGLKNVHFDGGGVSAMDTDFILKRMPRLPAAAEAVSDTNKSD